MSLEIGPARRTQSESLPSLFSNYERTVREGDQFQRHSSVTRHSISAASPVSPTNTMYGSAPYATPPESRKNSNSKDDGPRLSLPSLHEVGLAMPPSSQHPAPALYPPLASSYSHHPQSSLNPPPPPPPQPVTHPGPPSSANPYQHPHPYAQHHAPPPHTSESASYRYHEPKNYMEPHPPTPGPPAPPPAPPQPIHPHSDGFRQPHPYPTSQPTPSSQYSPRSAGHPPNGTNSSFNFAPTPAQSQYQYTPHAAPPTAAQPAPTSTRSPYSQSMPPPYPPYTKEVNGAHPAYVPGTSPQSSSLGKRPLATYGSAIDRALQVSSVRRDLDLIRTNSQNIFNLVQPLYEKDGGYQHQTLESVISGFQKAVQDGDQLRECLENCRRVLADMSKEFEEKSLQKGRHIPEYDTDDHAYADDGRSPGPVQPELKKMRRGRAAPPGRCHSCHRAETPEWRRGPDGARTLCNACGLHYAKLTRKMSKNNLVPGAITRKPGPTSPLS